MAIYHIITDGVETLVTRDKVEALKMYADTPESTIWRERLQVLDALSLEEMGNVVVLCQECHNLKSVSTSEFVASYRVWGAYRCDVCIERAAGESDFYAALAQGLLPEGQWF